MKIYIAGPMRGIAEYNFPAFMRAEEVLVREGWEVINPAQIDLDEGFDVDTPQKGLTKQDLEDYIMRDIRLVIKCDAICMLPEWGSSDGAYVEHAIARYCDIPVYSIDRTGRVTR